MNLEFAFRAGARVPTGADPAMIGARLEELRLANGGTLTTKLVLEAASNPADILHSWFDWNDNDAAQNWRLAQARQLVSSVVVIFRNDGDKEAKHVRAYISVATESAREYRAVSDMQNDDKLREAVLERAYMELKAFEKKYRSLQEFASLFSELETIERRIQLRHDEPALAVAQ